MYSSDMWKRKGKRRELDVTRKTLITTTIQVFTTFQ